MVLVREVKVDLVNIIGEGISPPLTKWAETSLTIWVEAGHLNLNRTELRAVSGLNAAISRKLLNRG